MVVGTENVSTFCLVPANYKSATYQRSHMRYLPNLEFSILFASFALLVSGRIKYKLAMMVERWTGLLSTGSVILIFGRIKVRLRMNIVKNDRI